MLRTISPLLLLATVAGFGCKSVNTVERDQPTYNANVIKDARIETDPFLSDKAKVLQVRQDVVQGDIMRIDVEIMNDKGWDGNFDYLVEWFDDHGMMVPTQSTWETRHAEARETISLLEVAPNPRCKDFRLKLQRSKRD